MKRYDPNAAPPPAKWLELDEYEQIDLVQRFHDRAGVELPNATLHAVIQTIVESQLAGAVPEVVTAFERLQREGLDRHEAIHAVGSVLTSHMMDLMNEGQSEGDPNARYFAELSKLTAATWRAS